MFRELLRDVVERTEGSVAGLLMGFDGIPVDAYVRDAGQDNIDVETVGMEYSVVLRDIKKASDMLEAGPTSEVAIRAERFTTIIRVLNHEYFVALTLRPEGNFGKGRFMLRTASPKLLRELV